MVIKIHCQCRHQMAKMVVQGSLIIYRDLFTKEVNPSRAKRALQFNAGLIKPGLSSLVK